MKAIFKREFRSYFTGGIGFVFCAVFAFVMNFSYSLTCLTEYQSSFLHLFNVMLLALILLIPLMTMRIWSEEKKQKTDQLLLTAPVTTMDIVLGKFLAALCVFLCALALTLVFPLLAGLYGTLEVGMVVGNYIAIILAASAYIAVSQFMSSLTESQIVAALASSVTLSVFFFLDLIFEKTNNDIVSVIVSFFSIITRYYSIYNGIFSLADVIYFISLIVLFLFLTSRVVEKRRWS